MMELLEMKLGKLRGNHAKHVPDLVLESTSVGVIDNKTEHLSGSHKANAGAIIKAWPADLLAQLPSKLRDYQAVFWDSKENTLLVVPKGDIAGRIPKIALRPNFKTKFGTSVSVVSLGFTDLLNLDAPQLKLIAGHIKK